MKGPCVVAVSGGMDSATVLANAKTMEFSEIVGVAFSYGSKHNPYENECAEKLCEYYDVELIRMSFASAAKHFQSNLLKQGGDIPEGHYEQSNMDQTVVPGRNLIFISLMLGVAWTRQKQSESTGLAEIHVGIHQGDHAIYPDCRRDFYQAMNNAVWYGSDQKVHLRAPYLDTDKIGILREGLKLGVPYDITRTCYKDQPIACGRCGACQERLEAFRENNTDDPIEYEFRGELPKE